jgi:hypothetical protein
MDVRCFRAHMYDPIKICAGRLTQYPNYRPEECPNRFSWSSMLDTRCSILDEHRESRIENRETSIQDWFSMILHWNYQDYTCIITCVIED